MTNVYQALLGRTIITLPPVFTHSSDNILSLEPLGSPGGICMCRISTEVSRPAGSCTAKCLSATAQTLTGVRSGSTTPALISTFTGFVVGFLMVAVIVRVSSAWQVVPPPYSESQRWRRRWRPADKLAKGHRVRADWHRGCHRICSGIEDRNSAVTSVRNIRKWCGLPWR